MIDVALEWYEASVAAHVGALREVESLRRGDQAKHKAARTEEPGWNLHLEGAAGELAACKALGWYWPATVNTFRSGGDVGHRTQVRTRSKPWYELYVRDDDRDECYFVLVIGKTPLFQVVGWIRARDAKRPEWRRDHGGWGPAFFVPHAALRPLEPAARRTAAA